MNSDWKIVQPKAKAQHVFDGDLHRSRQRERTGDDRTREDADAVAGHAVHGRAQHLQPAHRDVALVEPGQRLAAPQHVEERAGTPPRKRSTAQIPT
ncbi:MAG: hypothetical protein WDN31_11550 [Hyphomicrobium sp.]